MNDIIVIYSLYVRSFIFYFTNVVSNETFDNIDN